MSEAKIITYYSSFIASQEFINNTNIISFPLNVFNLTSRIYEAYGLNIFMSSLTNYNKWGNRDYHVKDGRSIYNHDSDAYLIVYNDSQPPTRIRFTILHEIGHIILQHKQCDIRNPQYYIYESEANTFASNALAPPILMRECMTSKGLSVNALENRFTLSRQAITDFKIADYQAWTKLTPHRSERILYERCIQGFHLLPLFKPCSSPPKRIIEHHYPSRHTQEDTCSLEQELIMFIHSERYTVDPRFEDATKKIKASLEAHWKRR